MTDFRWDALKNERLKKERGVSFEEIIASKFIELEEHPSRKNQLVMLFEYKDYIWVAPCVVEKDHIFLKTLFPSRKYTRKYRKDQVRDNEEV
jgi:uncharacterized DUF497 family protein